MQLQQVLNTAFNASTQFSTFEQLSSFLDPTIIDEAFVEAGVAVTDSGGRVNFASCFPGWYPSRAIHIHFWVKSNNNDQLVSQFDFSDQFCQSICTTHIDYATRGQPATLLATDTVFGDDYDQYLFDTQQNSDGSLLAYKRIVIS